MEARNPNEDNAMHARVEIGTWIMYVMVGTVFVWTVAITVLP